MQLWIKDPSHNNQPSISLTLLVVTFVATLVAAGCEIAGLSKTTSCLTDMLYSFCALHVGHRFVAAGKTYDSDKAVELEEKVETFEKKIKE